MLELRPIPALIAVALITGCASMEFAPSELGDSRGPFPDEVSDGIVFIGTDAAFTENVFLVDAADPGAILSLTTNQVDEWPQSDEQEEYYPGTLLAATAPYGVPDPTARYIAFVTVPTVATEPPEARVSLAEEYAALRTSKSIIGLQQVAFDPSGEYLVLTVDDQETGQTVLKVMDPKLDLADTSVSVINDTLGPAAVSDLQYEGGGRSPGAVLISGVQGDPGISSLWEVPLPDGDVTLLTAGLDKDALAPAVSAGGTYIAVELYDAENNRSDIAILDGSTGEWTNITAQMAELDYRSPRWEPSTDSGYRLAFLQYHVEVEEELTQLCLATHDEEEGWTIESKDIESQLGEDRLLGTPRWRPGGGDLLLDYRLTDNASGLNLAQLVLYSVTHDAAYILPTDGEPELAHWSQDGRKVLMWDRSVATNSESSERTPIRIYDDDTGRTESLYVSPPGGSDDILYVEYPLFLYHNTLWY